MLWETWATVIVSKDRRYLPRNYDKLSEGQKDHACELLRRERLLIAMLCSAKKKDETLQEECINNFQKEKVHSMKALKRAGRGRISTIIGKSGLQNRVADALYYAAVMVTKEGGLHDGLKETPNWILALHGVGPKIMSVVMQSAFGVTWGIPVDSHAFGISRGLQYVNDGDNNENLAAETLQSWLPKKHWYQFNMELASLGQVLDRGEGDDPQTLVNALLKNSVTKEWIVQVCT